MSIVVSDTSPIRALHFIGQIHLLHRIFGGVLVPPLHFPPVVARELAEPRRPFESIDVSALAFFEVRAPLNADRLAQYAEELDAGEAEAIALAVELGATLLIDETDGRATAAPRKSRSSESLAFSAKAKGEGLVGEVRPLLDRLRGELGFRVAERLYRQFLAAIGEV
jgi:predicted nucleic acid-binding protein